MTDKGTSCERVELGRREALWRLLLGTAVPIGLGTATTWAAGNAVQPAPPASPRILTLRDDSALARGLHPRTFLTPESVAALRTRIQTDVAFRERWQDAVSSFEESGGYWAENTTNPWNMSFAAFLACVRRRDDDLGLRWKSSWQEYRDRIVTSITSWNHNGDAATHALAHGFVYDMLYNDLTAAERDQIHRWMIEILDVHKGLKWQSAGGHWDDQTSDEHLAAVILSVAADDALVRYPRALRESLAYADAHDWMQYGEGIGYAWKDETVANLSPLLSLWVLKNALALSDSESTDHCLVSFRDTWQHVRQFTIPTPGAASSVAWRQARVNFQAPLVPNYHRGANVGANMLWALAILPGKVALADDGTLSNQTQLAKSEADLFGYAQYVMSATQPGQPESRVMSNVIKNYKWVSTGGPANEKGHMQTFLAFPAWLILGAQTHQPRSPSAAGIPRVRRWWPGTLNWVTIIGGTWESSSDQSLISYHHRRYFSNAYTAGCKQNGMWQVHRGGPLLIKRGATSHGPVGKQTWAGNGTVGFYPTGPEWALGPMDPDRGEVRDGKSQDHHLDMLKDPACDFGQMTAWYADSAVVALTSDLTRSYNSTVFAVSGNTPKISAFTREFVCVQRGADGTDHERIFTYDRIAVLGNGAYEPRYNLCPATDPVIDGVETPYTPWYPEPSGISVSDPVGATWKTKGPTRWDYADSRRMIYDNSTQRIPGDGKVCVTWLQPTGNGVVVRKRGGTNMFWDPPLKDDIDGSPSFGPWGELRGKDGAWNDVRDPSRSMYAGLFTVQVIPTTFNPDTRFLITCDVMRAGDAPSDAGELPCDGGSVAARCGASVVVFAKEAVTRYRGTVTVPSGASLVVLVNLPPREERTLTTQGGLAITTPSRAASSSGVLVVGVSGAGILEFR